MPTSKKRSGTVEKTRTYPKSPTPRPSKRIYHRQILGHHEILQNLSEKMVIFLDQHNFVNIESILVIFDVLSSPDRVLFL